MPLAQAYTSAVVQFRALRATFEAATKFAQLEAEFYGAQFGGGRIEAGLRAEEKVMDQWSTHQGASTSSNSAATPSSFTSLLDNSYSQPVDSLPWSGGKEYLRPQRRRPLQEESQTVLSPETSENQSDFSSSSDEQGLLLHALGGSNMPATHPLREPGVQPAPVEMDQYNGRHQPQQNRRAFKMVHRMVRHVLFVLQLHQSLCIHLCRSSRRNHNSSFFHRRTPLSLSLSSPSYFNVMACHQPVHLLNFVSPKDGHAKSPLASQGKLSEGRLSMRAQTRRDDDDVHNNNKENH